MIDFSDPKIRQAQIMADKMNENQCIVKNFLGGFDIKPESKVSVIYNHEILATIRPHRVLDSACV